MTWRVRSVTKNAHYACVRVVRVLGPCTVTMLFIVDVDRIWLGSFYFVLVAYTYVSSERVCWTNHDYCCRETYWGVRREGYLQGPRSQLQLAAFAPFQ